MSKLAPEKLVIAISSRALFNLDAEHLVYEEQGLEAYSSYQIEHEDTRLDPGQAFHLAKKLLALNDVLSEPLGVEIVLLSRNSADTGLRIFNSIEHYGLPITRAAFCGGESPWRYIQAFGCHLFLSSESADVRKALENNVAAATLVSKPVDDSASSTTIRFAFDGDADRVVFIDNKGRQVDGDKILDFLSSKLLKKADKFVTTIMTNNAIDNNLSKKGIKVIKTDVGDRNVYQSMVKNKSNFIFSP